MGFGPYSQIVKPAEWVDPLNLDLYAKGMMYKQQLAEKNLQDITDTYKSIASLPAYGPDKKKLAEIDQQFRQQLSSMDISDLSDMRSTSQIKGLLGQYTTNADVLAIAQRGSTYEKMLKEKNEAEKKNKVYMNRGMNQLSKYFNGEDYIQNLKFGNDGYIAPDAAEIMEQVKKVVTPDVKLVPDGKGQYQSIKYYDPEKLKKAFDMVTSSNPNWSKFHRDQVEEMFDGKNVEEYGTQHYNGLIQNYEELRQKAAVAMGSTNDKKKIAEYRKIYDQYGAEIEEVRTKLKNPYFGISFKQDFVKRSEQQDIDNMVSSINFVDQGDIKMDRATEMSKQLGNDLYKMQQKEFYELSPYMTPEDRAKIGTRRQNEINLTGYKQSSESAKAKAAALAANPNLAGTEIIQSLGGTYKEFTDLLAEPQTDGTKKIVNSPLTQAKIVDIIKGRPDLFPNIPPEVLQTLTPEHIEISDDSIEVDQSNSFFNTTYDITQSELLKAVQNTYMNSITPKRNIGLVEPGQGKTNLNI